MGWAKGSGFYSQGIGKHRQQQTSFVYEGPPFTSPGEVSGAPYGQEPYVRVHMPDRGSLDALAAHWSRTHVLIRWEDNFTTFNAWVPARWVQRITEEESRWRATDRLRRP